jgi:hypothetical protein
MQLRRIDPLQMRERIVDFFWRIRMWPYSTREDYFRFWDWRYRSLSEVEPAAWIALDGETIVGHIALYFRDLCVNSQRIRAGILANFRIDDTKRRSALAAALVGAPRAAVRRGELDLITAYGPIPAHQLAVALGYHDLGAMKTFVRVLRWSPVLRRRNRALLPMVPIVRAAARAHQLVRRAHVPDVPSFLVARTLTAAEVRSSDLSHWRANGTMNWSGSLEYYANRFCTSEFSSSRVFGVLDSRTDTIEALAAVTGSTRLTILQCDVNDRVMSRAAAVEAILRADPDVASVHVPILPGTDLTKEFTKAGYTILPSRLEGSSIREKSWSAWWRPEHPLAAELARTSHWNLWSGWTNY